MSCSQRRIAARTALTLSVLAVAASSATAADTRFGIHAGLWTDGSDPVVGGELLLPLHEPSWTINPNIEYVPGDHIDRWILNGDVLYDLDLDTKAEVWVGCGLAILFKDHDRHGNDTDLGVNLLAGAGLGTSSGLLPYVQGKVVITGDSSLALVLGLRF
jgi:hypothetical protein